MSCDPKREDRRVLCATSRLPKPKERGVYAASTFEPDAASDNSKLLAPATLKRFEAHAPRADLRRRAFTLLEVMIAVGILFMCLFAVMALLTNSLASARKLQQHRDIDTGSIAGLIYVELVNTNSLSEGPVDVDLEEMFPGSKCHADLTQVGTNGLCQVDFDVERNQKVEAQSHFFIYLPNMKVGGISRGLPQH
jgi:Tfp pilus assembly protein PilV